MFLTQIYCIYRSIHKTAHTSYGQHSWCFFFFLELTIYLTSMENNNLDIVPNIIFCDSCKKEMTTLLQ